MEWNNRKCSLGVLYGFQWHPALFVLVDNLAGERFMWPNKDCCLEPSRGLLRELSSLRLRSHTDTMPSQCDDISSVNEDSDHALIECEWITYCNRSVGDEPMTPHHMLRLAFL